MFDISLIDAGLLPAITIALVAGIFSFLSPCVLPIVPPYLAYMGGVSINDMSSEATARRRAVVAALFFVLGLSTVFVLLGFTASAFGMFFLQNQALFAKISGVVIIVFGLHFLGVVKIPLLYREARVESKTEPTTIFGAYVMGLAFGFGWTPCVGPALAAILMIASGMGDVWHGGLLLAAYGAGMTAPFVVAALFAKPFLNWASRNMALVQKVEKVMGAMLILFAVLIVTGGVQWIADVMIRWFPSFTTLG